MSYLLSKRAERRVTLAEAAAETGLSCQEVGLQLGKMGVERDGDEILVPKFSPKEWTRCLLNETAHDGFYSEEERQALIYLISYSEFEEVSLFHFQDFLTISKGTAINDVKKLRQFLDVEKVDLVYSRKRGFYLTGEELLLRRLAQNQVAHLLQTSRGRFGLFHWLNQQDLTLYGRIRDAIESQTKAQDLAIVPSRIDEVALLVGFSYRRVAAAYLQTLDEQEVWTSLLAYQASQGIFQQLFHEEKSSVEVGYLTIVLMTILQGESRDRQLDLLLNCSADIIHRMETLAAIQFSDFRELLQHLFCHLVPAYFRIRYGFYLPNVLIEHIQAEYAEIFGFTKEALLPLEQLAGKEIPLEEVGFFSILFGGEIANQKEAAVSKKIRGLIVCPNGISSSLILQSELKKMFPTIDFQEASSVARLHSIPEERYDVIFSTIPLETDKHVYVVKPLMSQLEKNQLINRVQGEWLIPGFSLPDAKEIVDALAPYIDVKKGVTVEKLYKILNKKMNRSIEIKEDHRPMLTELITREMIQISDQKLDWEGAIQLAAQPLLTHGLIEERYISAMIDKVKQYGAFIHIGKGIALPHARPEDGVKKIGMSLLKVKRPVRLLDDEKHEIQLFVCLAAVDNEAHLRALASLTRLLSSNEYLEELLAATKTEEILTILAKGEE